LIEDWIIALTFGGRRWAQEASCLRIERTTEELMKAFSRLGIR
jgi:hypothetical protein